jgi:cell fate regulator YaaT (PSP1 superfamily)
MFLPPTDGSDRQFQQQQQGQGQPFQPMYQQQQQQFQPMMQDSVGQLVYQVQFKNAFRYFVLATGLNPSSIHAGDFVKVEADRGDDLGVVTEIMNMKEFINLRVHQRTNISIDDDSGNVRSIVRIASIPERQALVAKMQDEQSVINLCQQLVMSSFKLPMTVVDAEYQFDRRKLIISYYSDCRIDFREFVRNLFGACKARIWMKKVGQYDSFVPKEYAVMALSTGVQFPPASL